ncbi:MAG TPA: methylmalonyl-CoA mutase family protein, partial [Solirubrobacterales bacterium]|nr:methylmalonyl-CoA mutase family protein [Solirubrobacterales bacterium]
LTNRIEAQAYEYFEQIDKLGGMVEAIKQNFPQREIADAAFQYQAEVEQALAELKRAAATDENLMPPIIAAARARASEGEMIAAMQEVFGTYTESPVF